MVCLFGLNYKKLIKLKHIFSILCLCCFTGCYRLYFPVGIENTAKNPINIEVLRPADTTINQSVKKVLAFAEPGLVPKVTIDEGNKKISAPLKFDKISNIEFHAMADLLSASPRFEIMEPVNPVKPPTGKFFTWDEIDSICIKAGVDACLFLSKQEVNISFMIGGHIFVTSLYELYSPRGEIVLTKEVKQG